MPPWWVYNKSRGAGQNYAKTLNDRGGRLNEILRFIQPRRNLLLCKRKNRLAGRFFEGSASWGTSEPW